MTTLTCSSIFRPELLLCRYLARERQPFRFDERDLETLAAKIPGSPTRSESVQPGDSVIKYVGTGRCGASQ